MKKLLWIALIGTPTLILIFLTYAVSIAIQQMPESAEIIKENMPKPIMLVTSSEVEAKLNEFRVSKGLAPFNAEIPALDQAAQSRAEAMCAENDWTHNKAWTVLNQYYAGSYIGENLYYAYLQENQAADSISRWAASPTHLENMMKGYTEIGVGVKSCPGFQGEPTAVIVTNYFGVPR